MISGVQHVGYWVTEKPPTTRSCTFSSCASCCKRFLLTEMFPRFAVCRHRDSGGLVGLSNARENERGLQCWRRQLRRRGCVLWGGLLEHRFYWWSDSFTTYIKSHGGKWRHGERTSNPVSVILNIITCTHWRSNLAQPNPCKLLL